MPTIIRIFELAAEGVPDSNLARTINAEGFRTRREKPFERRSIQAIVTNPTYAALVVHEGEEYEGKWTPLIDRETWHSIQRQRAKRDLGPGQHAKGRPAHRHLLAKLARCGACGAPMFVTTSSYVRKDGTRARSYACRGYRYSDGTCDVKVDAEVIDTAVLENLPKLMPRFDEWIAQIEDRHAAERQRLVEQRERAVKERDGLAERLRKAEDRFVDADDEDQERMRSALDRRRDEFRQAEVRVQATADAVASVPQDASYDRLLDFATSLRSVIAGRLDGDHTVRELNLALTELFASFTICRELADGTMREEAEDALRPGSLYVFPNLRREVTMRLLAEYDADADEAVPLEWLEALAAADGLSGTSQERWHSGSSRIQRTCTSTLAPRAPG